MSGRIETAGPPAGQPSRNVEIKARLDRVDAVRGALLALGAEGPVEIAQADTFFHSRTGRLKLRDFGGGRGELIFYDRGNTVGPKQSSYIRAPTLDVPALRDALSLALGVSGRVVKQRSLWLIGRTRVHLDRVEGLGDFIELEVVLRDDENAAAGNDEARRLMAALAIAEADCVAGAYAELLAADAGAGAPASSAVEAGA